MPTTELGPPVPYGLKLTGPPASEPVTLEQAKGHLRVELDVTDDDDYITELIEAARDQVEDCLDQALITQTWRLTLDSFPPWHFDEQGDRLRSAQMDAILRMVQAYGTIPLPRPPLQSVASITYVDVLGATQTLSSSLYQVDTDKRPGRVAPAFNTIWPATRPQIDCVRINFLAGYGDDGADVPASIRLAIKVAVAQWYQNRAAPDELPAGIRAMLLRKWHGTY